MRNNSRRACKISRCTATRRCAEPNSENMIRQIDENTAPATIAYAVTIASVRPSDTGIKREQVRPDPPQREDQKLAGGRIGTQPEMNVVTRDGDGVRDCRGRRVFIDL